MVDTTLNAPDLSSSVAPPAVGHHIGGDRLLSGEVRDAHDPATGQVLGSFHDADSQVVTAAITTARRCFTESPWRSDRGLRARALLEMADAVENASDSLVAALCRGNGKVVAEATFEVSMCAPKLRYCAALAVTDLGTSAQASEGALSILVHEPVGVAGVIVPWNAPVVLAVRSLAPALAAGCTAVVKLPAQTALVNAMLADILCTVPSLPPGVLNFFTESGDAGAKELVSSVHTDVISYTGSTAVGARIMAAAAPGLKRVSLELGGKTPMIVFDDANLDVAIPTIVAGITTFAGQFCMAGSRILVQEGIAEQVKARLAEGLSSVRVGPASDPSSQMGPMIDRAACERVDRRVSEMPAEDIIVRGGARPGPGAFFEPALVSVQDMASPFLQEEIFGPVATFETFVDENDAVARANGTSYGLAASVWTDDGARSLRVSMALQAGTVWTNTWAQVRDQFEEGGYKGSGVGRLNGPGGLREFQEVKHIFRPTA